MGAWGAVQEDRWGVPNMAAAMPHSIMPSVYSQQTELITPNFNEEEYWELYSLL